MISFDLITGSPILLDKKEIELTINDVYVNVAGDVMTGDLALTPTANSTITFQVNQSGGTNVLTVDTTNKDAFLEGRPLIRYNFMFA